MVELLYRIVTYEYYFLKFFVHILISQKYALKISICYRIKAKRRKSVL